MIRLDDVTLIGIDCVDVDRVIKAAEISAERIAFGRIRLLSSKASSHRWVEPIGHLGDIEAYNDFVIKRLPEFVETSHALLIQHDGFVLNPDAWTTEYLDFDYIGAPWAVNGERVVGNGGFSLRSRRLLDRLTESDIERDRNNPEDWFICVSIRDRLVADGIRFAPAELAHRFSFEGDPAFGVSWHRQFGFHGLTWTDISEWLAQHPESGVVNELDEESRALLRRGRP